MQHDNMQYIHLNVKKLHLYSRNHGLCANFFAAHSKPKISALKNRYSWSIMTNNARDLVTRELNWRYCAKRMLSEYKQVLILTKESF